MRGRLWCSGEEDDAGGAPAQPVDRVCVGGSLLHHAQEGVFHSKSSAIALSLQVSMSQITRCRDPKKKRKA
jgi:hypothetical protein